MANSESADDNCIQGAIVITCYPDDDSHPSHFIQNILETAKAQVKPTTHTFGHELSVNCYPWTIENKYYSALIHLFDTHNTKSLISQEFADYIHGVIIKFDNHKESSFDLVKSWLPFINEYEPEIKLIVCETAKDDDCVTRRSILDWCIENEFELIELEAQEESEDEEVVDDFKESNGIVRIIQALQAHRWPDMRLKDDPGYRPTKKFESLLSEEIARERLGHELGVDECHLEHEENDIGNQQRVNTDLLGEEDKRILESLSQDNAESQSFEDLFSKFADMKERADRLEGDERRIYAERVAMAFWNALGGEEEEKRAQDGLGDDHDQT